MDVPRSPSHDPVRVDTDCPGDAEAQATRASRVNAALAELYGPLIDTATSVDAMAKLVLDQARRLTGSVHGYVATIDPATGTLLAHTLTEMYPNDGRAALAGPRPVPRDPDGAYPALWGHTLNSRQPVCTNTPKSHQASRGTPLGHIPVERFLSVPVLMGEELVGQIALANAPIDYTDADCAAVVRLAGVFALAVQRARTDAALRRRTTQLETVRTLSHELVREIDLSRLLRLITTRARELLSAPDAGLFVWHADIERLVPEVWMTGEHVPANLTVGLGEGLVGLVAQERRGRIVNSYRTWASANPAMIASTGAEAALAEPLLYHDRLLGVIAVAACIPGRTFTPDDAELLRLLAASASIALQNARLYQAEQSRRRQIDAVRAISADLTRELNLTALLGVFIERTVTLFAGVSGAIYLVDPATDLIVPQASLGHDDRLSETRLNRGEGIPGTVIQRRKGLIDNAYQSSPYATPSQRERADCTAVLAEPLVYHEQVIGAVVVDRRSAFDTTDAELLRLLADQAASAIENARLYGDTERRRREAEVLAALAQTITASLDLDTVLHRVADGAKSLCAGDVAAVAIPEEGILTFRTWVGTISHKYAALRIPSGQGLVGKVFAEGHPLRTANYTEDPMIGPEFHAIAELEGTIAQIAVPVRAETKVVGVLIVLRRRAEPFSNTDEAILIRLADHAAIALANAGLYQAAVRRATQLATVHSLSRDLAAAPDPQAALQAILRAATVLIPDTVGQVWEQAQDRLAHLTATTAPRGEGAVLQETLRRDEGLAGLALSTGRPVVSTDVRIDARFVNQRWASHEGFVAALAVPLMHRDSPRGALVLLTRAPHVFSEEEVALLQLFANDAAATLEKAHLIRAEQRRREQLETVRSITAEITRELNLAVLLKLIAVSVADLFHSNGAVWLWNETARALVPGAVTRGSDWEQDQHLTLGEGLVGRVAEQQEGLCVNDYRVWPHARRAILERTAISAAMAEPLLYRDRLIGVISIDSETAGAAYADEDRQLLRLFADHAAIALANAQLFQAQQAAYTDLQRAQEELVRAEKLRALGQLAAGVAHDLNNALAAVLGQAELLRLGGLDARAQEALATLELAATDGALIVQRLQDFARQRASGSLSPCHAAEIVSQALEFTRPQWKDAAERQGRQIAVAVDLSGLPPILGDASALREAFANLILNAVDAMPQGGALRIAGRIAAATGAEPRAAVEIAVSDTGVGMPDEIRQRVFEPFFTTKGIRGTGLGLAVVYGIVERHGGRITVASTPGEGTTFTLRLQAAAESATGASAPAPTPPTSPRRILVVDDEPLVRTTLGTLLRTAGHVVSEAPDGPAGLAQLVAEPVDLVLTDLGMPGMTGLEVARTVKATHPNVPVVLLTGWGAQATRELPPDPAVDRILGKPVRLAELLSAIADLTRT